MPVNGEVLSRINELDRKFHRGELFYPEKYDNTMIPIFDETEVKNEIQGAYQGLPGPLLPKALEYFRNVFRRAPRPELAREEAITAMLETFEIIAREMVENLQEERIHRNFCTLKRRARCEFVPLVNMHQTIDWRNQNLDDDVDAALWRVELHLSLLPEPFKGQALNAIEIAIATQWEEANHRQFRPSPAYKAPPPLNMTYYTGPGQMIHQNLDNIQQLAGMHDGPGNPFFLTLLLICYSFHQRTSRNGLCYKEIVFFSCTNE